MEIVVLVSLEMILPPTVPSCWRDQHMYSVPHEGEGRRKHYKRRPQTTEVVEMLDRVHAESSERFDVGVPVMDSVDVFVQGLDMDEPVGKVEVELAIKWDPESG